MKTSKINSERVRNEVKYSGDYSPANANGQLTSFLFFVGIVVCLIIAASSYISQ